MGTEDGLLKVLLQLLYLSYQRPPQHTYTDNQIIEKLLGLQCFNDFKYHLHTNGQPILDTMLLLTKESAEPVNSKLTVLVIHQVYT